MTRQQLTSLGLISLAVACAHSGPSTRAAAPTQGGAGSPEAVPGPVQTPTVGQSSAGEYAYAPPEGHGHHPGPGAHHKHGSHHKHGQADHHSAHHRFDDAEAWAKRFEDPSRDAWQKPDAVLSALSLSERSTLADIGAASGYFPVRAAKLVPQGRVWGVDIEPSMVAYLNERARRESLPNLFSILGTPTDPLIPEPVDVVLVVNTYHHLVDRSAYFSRLRARLKRAGRVAIVDFKQGDLPLGPPPEMRIAPEVIVEEMAKAGFTLAQRDDDILPYQHLLIFSETKAQP